MMVGCKRRRLGLLLLAVAGAFVLGACGGGGGGDGDAAGGPGMAPPVGGNPEPVPTPLDPTGQAPGELYAMLSTNRLLTFNPGASAASTNVAITGIGNDER